MIFANSRYDGAELEYVSGPDEDRRLVIVPPRFYGTAFGARSHVVTEGQRLDQIAALYYGDAESWWAIAIANPEIMYPENIAPGTVLRIPDAPALL